MKDALKGWHLRKEVTVGQIITIITILFSGLWYISTVETRLSLLEREDSVLLSRIDTTDKGMVRALDQINITLRRIEDKLDRKADK